ncbi:MAG: hypothetical protein Q4C96_00880 [Planctomycetia bacterium]|nr:hypothetical protein [Planctomycetia bacterium]
MDNFLLPICCAVAAFIFLCMTFLLWKKFGKKRTSSPKNSVTDIYGQNTEPESVPDSRLSIPMHLFQSEWMQHVNKNLLEDFVQQVSASTTIQFLDSLKKHPPFETDHENWRKISLYDLRKNLSERVFSPAFFEILNAGKPITDKQARFLKNHLNELMPPIQISSPVIVKGELNTWVISLLAAGGALLGILGGASVVNFLTKIPTETGMMMGSAISTFLTVAFCIFLINRPGLRKWLLTSVGMTAGADTLFQILKIPFPIFIKGKSGFLKRIFFYIGAFFIIFLLKRKNEYQLELYHPQVELTVRQWIMAAASLTVVLMYRAQEMEENPFNPHRDEHELLNQITRLITDSIHADNDTRSKIFNTIMGKLALAGYAFPFSSETEVDSHLSKDTPKAKIFLWDKSREMEYDLYEPIFPGEWVREESPPIYNNDGKVITRGIVRKSYHHDRNE